MVPEAVLPVYSLQISTTPFPAHSMLPHEARSIVSMLLIKKVGRRPFRALTHSVPWMVPPLMSSASKSLFYVNTQNFSRGSPQTPDLGPHPERGSPSVRAWWCPPIGLPAPLEGRCSRRPPAEWESNQACESPKGDERPVGNQCHDGARAPHTSTHTPPPRPNVQRPAPRAITRAPRARDKE